MSKSVIVIIMVALALLLLCCCLAAAFFTFGVANFDISDIWFGGDWSHSTVSTSSTSEMRVNMPASVLVVNQVGEVRVRTGSDDVVTVQAVIEARAASRAAAESLVNRVNIRTNSSGDQATIEVERPQTSGVESLSVKLEITVPRATDLELRNNVGEINVSGIEGRLSISGDVGEVKVRDVVLTGDSSIRADVGKVTFRGELPDVGQVSIETDIGEVEVSLPRSSQFVLDAAANIGEISCDFELADRRGGEERGPGDQLSGVVGTDPQVTLTLRTNTGGIKLGY